jgi:general secretion pathway protein A
MYNNFFGFKERPFQLVPNPAYLFLSRSHEEAMAHLMYAISQGDGFVEITGEVGTGKTTLCRAVLENLDKFTEAAYIFNPKLDSLQLLKAINDEFGIASDADNTKGLIDTLNAFLMKKKVEGKKVLVIIDEAQNLSKEVLEQLRLLSNLETTTSKLLQIILVGQPELRDVLDSNELRQLGQRIALTCHLSPLTYKETRQYIQHRIQVASQKPEVKFAGGAYRAIYRYSGGIPRLINISCDRALLTAFGLNRKVVTGIIARASIREVAGRADTRRAVYRGQRKMPLSFGILLGVFVAVLYLATIYLIIHKSVDTRLSTVLKAKDLESPKVTLKLDENRAKSAPVPNEISPPPESTLPTTPEKDPVENPEPIESKPESPKPEPESSLEAKAPSPVAEDPSHFISSLDSRSSRSKALKRVLDSWVGEVEISASLNEMEDDSAFFRITARQNGLQLLGITENPDLLRKLNLPAVLDLRLPGSPSPRYAALMKIQGDAFVFSDPEDADVQWNYDQVKSYWSGTAYVPWKDFLGYEGVIQYGSSSDAVVSLKTFLHDLGYQGIKIGPLYDEQTRTVARGIQGKHGIPTDGGVGPLTKIVIYNENRSLDIPHLTDNQ